MISFFIPLCNEGITVDGVTFGENQYTTIGYCCESIMTTYEEPLSTNLCIDACGADGNSETWYPLYNAFATNTHVEGPLGYYLRQLLVQINEYNCQASATDIFAMEGFERIA